MRKPTQEKKTTTIHLVEAPEASPTPTATSPTGESDAESNAQESEMLTYAAVARLTGIRIGTIYSLVHRRELPCYRLGARIIRFKSTEIAEWMASKRQPAQGPEAR